MRAGVRFRVKEITFRVHHIVYAIQFKIDRVQTIICLLQSSESGELSPAGVISCGWWTRGNAKRKRVIVIICCFKRLLLMFLRKSYTVRRNKEIALRGSLRVIRVSGGQDNMVLCLVLFTLCLFGCLQHISKSVPECLLQLSSKRHTDPYGVPKTSFSCIALQCTDDADG